MLTLQGAVGNRAVAGLLAHRPPPTAAATGGSGSTLQRSADSEVALQRTGPADSVVDLTQVAGVWHLRLRGFTNADAVGAFLFPGGVPAGIRIAPVVVVTRPATVGLFDITGLTMTAMRALDPALSGLFTEKGAGTVIAKPPPTTQYLDFDVGPTDPAHPDQIQLVSRQISARADYIDARMRYLEYSLYLHGFNVYLDGEPDPIYISNVYLEDRTSSISVGDRIFDSVAEAKASIAAFTPPGDTSPRHAYYWGAGGKVIAPTVFSLATTPRIMNTLFAARAELARQVEEELTGLAATMITFGLLGKAYNRARTSFAGDVPPRVRATADPKSAEPGAAKAPEPPATEPTPKMPAGQEPAAAKGKAPVYTPEAARWLTEATTTDIAQLKAEGFVYERVNANGLSASYRNPVTGERAHVTLRRGGASWMDGGWGRGRLESELRTRGFRLDRATRGEGGLLYRNAQTGEEIRIMPKPSEQFRDEPIEKHLNGQYYRYRRNGNVEWGDHTTILDTK